MPSKSSDIRDTVCNTEYSVTWKVVMTDSPELKELEQQTYEAKHTDGVIDMFVGLSAVVIGAAWMVVPGILSGVTALVAICISPVLARRRRFVEERTGYVRFAEPRRLWERRIYTTVAVLFGGFMLLARPLGALQDEDIDWLLRPDTAVVWFVATVLLVLGLLTGLNRLYGYAVVLTVAGTAAVMMGGRLGWPLVVSGVVALLAGSVLMRRFISHHPRLDAS